MAEVAGSDAGAFNPNKVRDQLRVGFQASQVVKRKRRNTDKEQKPPKRRRKRKAGESLFTSSDEEELRDDSVFQDTLVPYDSTTNIPEGEVDADPEAEETSKSDMEQD